MVLKKKGHPRYRAHIKGYQSQKAGSPFLYFTLNMIEGTGRQSSYIHFFFRKLQSGLSILLHSYTFWCRQKWNNENIWAVWGIEPTTRQNIICCEAATWQVVERAQLSSNLWYLSQSLPIPLWALLWQSTATADLIQAFGCLGMKLGRTSGLAFEL